MNAVIGERSNHIARPLSVADVLTQALIRRVKRRHGDSRRSCVVPLAAFVASLDACELTVWAQIRTPRGVGVTIRRPGIR
jgi:hypothetical protein